jgi:hypothetical protein
MDTNPIKGKNYYYSNKDKVFVKFEGIAFNKETVYYELSIEEIDAFIPELTYYKERKYYMTQNYNYISNSDIEKSYLILSPYRAVGIENNNLKDGEDTDFSKVTYEKDATYWTYALLKHTGNYNPSYQYFEHYYDAEELGEKEEYESDIPYLKQIEANTYFYTRAITLGAKINSRSMSDAVRANIRVTY